MKYGRFIAVVLINSFFHHISDEEVVRIAGTVASSLRDGGIVILQEPVVPEKKKLYYRLMMKLDRGNYFRTIDHWKELLSKAGLVPKKIDFYYLRIMGIRGYHMAAISLYCPMKSSLNSRCFSAR